MDFEFSFIFVKCLNKGEWFEWFECWVESFECYTFKGGLNAVTLGLMVMVASSMTTKPKRLPFDQSIANCAPVKITTATPRQDSNLKLDPSTQLWSHSKSQTHPNLLLIRLFPCHLFIGRTAIDRGIFRGTEDRRNREASGVVGNYNVEILCDFELHWSR